MRRDRGGVLLVVVDAIVAHQPSTCSAAAATSTPAMSTTASAWGRAAEVGRAVSPAGGIPHAKLAGTGSGLRAWTVVGGQDAALEREHATARDASSYLLIQHRSADPTLARSCRSSR